MTGTHPDAAAEARSTVARLLSGDPEAFRALYRSETPRLFRRALAMMGGVEADAEDVVQETWRRAIDGLGTFAFRSSLSTWLSGIAWRCAVEALRARGKFDPLHEGPGPCSGGPLPDAADRVDLERAFEAMPAGYRAVLLLHDLEGYRHADIAGMLGVSEGTSKSQLSRARSWMREALGPAYFAEGRG